MSNSTEADMAADDFSSALEIRELIPHVIEVCRSAMKGSRLNLVIPAISEKWLFGGAATALRLFERLSTDFEYARIVVMYETESQWQASSWPEWIVDCGSVARRSVVFLGNRSTRLSVSGADFFLATLWSAAVYVRQVMAQQIGLFPNASRRFVYFIQDYEPGFYPWSARYVIAKSTYRDRDSAIAIFNTRLLAEYFGNAASQFSEQYIYEPILHPKLHQKRAEIGERRKERLILIYGRPSHPRNGFDIIAVALKIWASTCPSTDQWSVISLGEKHVDVPLGRGAVLRSGGKLTLDEYAQCLARCWVGLSFMFSPHPGYTALEMAEFGAWVITNKFENKDLSEFGPNFISMDELTPQTVAEKIVWCCSQYPSGRTSVGTSVVRALRDEEHEFPFADSLVNSWRQGGPR